MQKINIEIFIGDTADTAISNPLPAGITSYSPFIRWKLPAGIQQSRVALKITNVNNPSLSAIFKSVTVAQQYQIPIGNGLNSLWTGACFIEIQVSKYISYSGQEFQYTSGNSQQNPNGFFVIDSVIEKLTVGKNISYLWQKSIDQNVQQTLIYHLQVAKNPMFMDETILLNETAINGTLTGLINYNSYALPIGNYFFRVRAYDGYDYSEWSVINCFKVVQFNPPILRNLTYQITYNETGDVILSFQTYNQADIYTSVILYYSYADDLSVQYPCILSQTSHIVPNQQGQFTKNTVTWQTAKNATGNSATLKNQGMQKTNIIEDVDLYLYAYPYYNGTQGQVVYLPIHLNNSIYDVTTSAVGTDIKQEYLMRSNIVKLPTYSYYNYTGYYCDLYFYIKNTDILTEKKYTLDYLYYKAIIELPIISNPLWNNNLFSIYSSLHKIIKTVKYIGWNSQIYDYIYNNRQLLTDNIVITDETFRNYEQTGVFNGNYYYEFLSHYDNIDTNKYTKQNPTQFRLLTENKGNFSLYVDGRTFRGNDKSEYTVKEEKANTESADAWVFSNGGGSDSQDQGIIVIPSYQKDVMFNPKYPKQAKLKQSSGRNKYGQQFSVQGDVNWVECTADMDWDFYVAGQRQTKYYAIWGGSLQKAKDKDQNLQKLNNATIKYSDFYSKNKYGSMTFPDGKLNFQDNEQSAQFTMYPNYYTKNGYPIGISQKYWQYVKSEELYIRKYKIVKGGKQSTSNGYKDFEVVKSNGQYHCYFTNKTIPQTLVLKHKKLLDEFGVTCYQQSTVQINYRSTKCYIKLDKRYKDLPEYLFICVQNSSSQNKIDDISLDDLYYYNNDDFNNGSKQALYFHTYIRRYLNYRGKSPQLKVPTQENTQNSSSTSKQTPFSNVAVPQYVKSINGVYSANNFNGKQSAFNLNIKFKRDGRRYILGHHYNWGKKVTDETILKTLNQFIEKCYPQLQSLIDGKRNINYENVVLGFKYKRVSENDLKKIEETKYIYAPTQTDGNLVYAWFQDKSIETFKNNSNSRIASYWSDIQNDDYIYIHRDTIEPQFTIGKDNDVFKSFSDHTITCQGTKFLFQSLKDQAYYSDKSKFGVESFYYTGDLSDVITQKYKKDSINEFVSIPRTIFLDHQKINSSSVSLQYYNQFGDLINIRDFQLYQGNNGYNAYILLNQNHSYIDKQIIIKYKYYIYDIYSQQYHEYNNIIFNDYNDTAIFKNEQIINETFELYKIDENGYEELIPKQYYQLIKDNTNNQTILQLLFYYKNKTLDVSYNYKQQYDLGQQQYQISQIDQNYNLQLLNYRYVINNINPQIIEKTISLHCLDKSNRDHQITNYTNNFGRFEVDSTKRIYSSQKLKPIKIKYKYNVVKQASFDIVFDNFSANLLNYYANINGLQVYYILQNGLNIYVTDKFILKSGSQIVTSGVHRNVKLIVNTTDIVQLSQLFENTLYVSYDGNVEGVYLQLQKKQDNRFLSSNGYGHTLYLNGVIEQTLSFYFYELNEQNQLYIDYQYLNVSRNTRFIITNSENKIVDENLYQYVWDNTNLIITFDFERNNSQYSQYSDSSYNIDVSTSERWVIKFLTQNQHVQLSRKFYSISDRYISLTPGENYKQILPYINIPITVQYNANIDIENIYCSLQDSIVFIDQNYIENENNIGIINNGSTYRLPNINIDEFDCYYVNNRYTLSLIPPTSYTLNKDTGQFNLIDHNYFYKMIVFIYSYKQYVYQTTDNEIILTNISQQFALSKNIVNETFRILNEKSTTTHTFTQSNLIYDINDNSVVDVRLLNNNVELTNNQYSFENNIIIITDTSLINTPIKIIKYIELQSNQYERNDINNILTFLDNTLVNKSFRIIYTYLKSINILSYNNNILCDKSSEIYFSQNKLIQKQQYLKNDGNNYVNNDVNYEAIKEWELYYCDDYTKIENYQYDKENNCIIIQYNINNIDQYIWLKYSIYQDMPIRYTDHIDISTSTKKYPLTKGFVYNVQVFYTENNITKYLLDSQYEIESDTMSYLKLIDRYFNYQLRAEYDEYDIHNKTIIIQCNSPSLFLTDELLITDSVSIKYTKNGVEFPLNADGYNIVSIEGQYYIYLQNQYIQYCFNEDLIVEYSYRVSKHNDSNKNIQNLKFEEFRKTLNLSNGNIYNLTISYLNDQGYYENIPSQAYTYTSNDNTASVTLLDNYLLKYLDKILKIDYTTQNTSDEYTYQFINDRSLIFSNKDSYIVLSNAFIDPSTFKMYYETNLGMVLIPRNDYLLDIGSEQFYGVVVLNKKSSNINNYLNKRLYIEYQYFKNPRKIFNKQNEKFPYLDYIHRYYMHENMYLYNSGYTYDYHIGYLKKLQPVYQGDYGHKWVVNLKQYSDYASLQFLYLQSFWDAYNTIHIDGMINSATRIILQYAVYGTSQRDDNLWYDFKTIDSTFDEQLNHYILPKSSMDVYVDTFDESIFTSGVTYILRMMSRGSSSSNSGTAQWVYSIPFTIDHDAVNPVNITNISYNNWNRYITITFRIDDTQGDLYDITGLDYTSDGRNWHSVDLGDILGNLWYLQSNKRNQKNTIFHVITWKAGSYNLTASSSYRVRIIANYTKFNQGDQPIFQWRTSLNPLIEYYQNKLKSLQGGKQYYKYVYETLKQVQNEDGTITYEELQTPLAYWQKIQPYQKTYTVEVLDDDGNVVLDEHGQPVLQEYTQTIDYYYTKGQIVQLEEKLEEIRNKPYKTVTENGETKTIPWGYRQFYNQDLTEPINLAGYDKWLRTEDTDYGETRMSLIQELNEQIDSKREQAASYREKILFLEMNIRKNLIRQGFYSNGFLYNEFDSSDPTPFRFRIFIKALTQTQQQYFKNYLGLSMLEVKYQYQLDFYDTFDSQYNHKPLRDLYSYTRNNITSEILAGMNEESTSSLYQGYFFLENEKQPGKLKTDELIKNYSNYTGEYYWRVRPFTEFTDTKREIPFVEITNIVSNTSNVQITFNLHGQSDLGTLTIYKPYTDRDQYYMYVQRKSDNIYLLNPRRKMNEHSLSENNNTTKVNFVTDRLRNQKGNLISGKITNQDGTTINLNDYFKNWISFSNRRQRPTVYFFQGQYYLFYDKNSVTSEDTMYMSLSKDGNQFGEYMQIYPNNTNQKLSDNDYKYLMNGFITRENDSFYLYVCGQPALYNNSMQIYYLKSDYLGQNWEKPVLCNGLTNCNYPSVFKSKMKQVQKNQTKIVVIDIMLCQKVSNDDTIFKFYYSQDKYEWESATGLTEDKTILCNINLQNISKDNLKLKDISDYDNIAYISPYLFQQKDSEIFYLYFCVLNKTTYQTDIYRTYSYYDNTENKYKWTQAQKIIENGFNPSVIEDYYYGQKYHRIYFNKKETLQIYNNKQNYVDYTIHNCYITKLNNSQFIRISVNRISSQQIQSYSINNIKAGDYEKCTYCNGNGKINNSNCSYCNGKGHIDYITYKITADKSSLEYPISEYDLFVKLDKKYTTKLFRKYGDWLDYQSASMMQQQFRPSPKYRFLDV